MIVPSISVLYLASLAFAAGIQKRQASTTSTTSNATPSQAAAAGLTVNTAIAEIIIAISSSTQQAAAVISLASAASVALTAVKTPTSTVASSTSSSSSSSAALAACTNPVSGNQLPNLINASKGACATVCGAIGDAITACVNSFSTNDGLATCSCQASFVAKVAACGACEDTNSGNTFGTGNSTTYCYSCSSQGYSDASACPLPAPPPTCPPPLCASGSGADYTSNTCALCPAGYFSQLSATHLNVTFSRCTNCPNGSYSPTNSSSCTTCAAFNSTTDSYASCSATTGDTTNCNVGYQLSTLPSPKLCVQK